MERDQLEAFCRCHSTHMTYIDMSEETGETYKRVRELCIELDLPTISASGITKQYMLDMKGKLSLEYIAKRLKMSMYYMSNMCSELGLSPADFELQNSESLPCPTFREILSGYQLNAANHYVNY